VGKTRIDAANRGEEAEAIRSDDAHEVWTARRQHILLELRIKTSGYYDGCAAAPLAKLGHKTRDHRRGSRNDSQIGSSRQLSNRPETWNGTYLLGGWIHRQDRSGIAAFEQVAGKDASDRPLLVAGADQGDGFGREQGIEVPGCHEDLLSTPSARPSDEMAPLTRSEHFQRNTTQACLIGVKARLDACASLRAFMKGVPDDDRN
jgi:hypothetical protein